MTLLSEYLDRRLKADATSPFVTHYENGQRTELSVRTFANWVNKTANLLITDADLAAGDKMRLAVAEEHPGHWMTMVWVMAAWKVGLEIVTGGDADVCVTGPDGPAAQVPTYACSLHPLGRPLVEPPAGCTDFSSAALSQPDEYLGVPADAEAPAIELDGIELNQTRLVELVAGSDDRVLVLPRTLWAAIVEILISPLMGSGSTVVVAGEVSDEIRDAIIAAERIGERPSPLEGLA